MITSQTLPESHPASVTASIGITTKAVTMGTPKPPRSTITAVSPAANSPTSRFAVRSTERVTRNNGTRPSAMTPTSTTAITLGEPKKTWIRLNGTTSAAVNTENKATIRAWRSWSGDSGNIAAGTSHAMMRVPSFSPPDCSGPPLSNTYDYRQIPHRGKAAIGG